MALPIVKPQRASLLIRLTRTSVLARHRDFRIFWASETISLFGTEVTFIALPLTAILFLNATPAQVGALAAASAAPVLLVSLFAGVWVDRTRRRPLLIAANLGRAGVIAMVPALALTDALSMPFLYLTAFGAGALTAVFDIAYLAYVPSVVARGDLVAANSALQGSSAVSRTGGPALGGVLVQTLTAPLALLVDAVSYLLAAGALILVRSQEALTPRPRRSLRAEIAEGLRFTLGEPKLRALIGNAAWFNFWEQAVLTLYLLYGIRALGLEASVLGLTIAAGSVGSLAATLVAGKAGAILGAPRAILAGMALACVAPLAVPVVPADKAVTVVGLAGAFALYGFGLTIFNVHAVSLRQAITPDEILGRMTASYRLVAFGAIPLGAACGGLLGSLLGVRETLFLASAALLVGCAAFALTPVVRTGTGAANP